MPDDAAEFPFPLPTPFPQPDPTPPKPVVDGLTADGDVIAEGSATADPRMKADILEPAAPAPVTTPPDLHEIPPEELASGFTAAALKDPNSALVLGKFDDFMTQRLQQDLVAYVNAALVRLFVPEVQA